MIEKSPIPLHPNVLAAASYRLQPSSQEDPLSLRKFAFFATVFAILVVVPSLSSAQQADAIIGFGSTMATGSSNTTACTTTFTTSCVGPEKGGLYTTISGDIIFKKRVGFNFEANWRTKQGLDGAGQFYRPILFDFNGVYQPRITKKVGADLMAGIGWQSTRFYGFQPTASCELFNACYTSNNHFLVHVGGGIRYYFFGNAFIRPEVHIYHIMNNSDVFTNSNVVRAGASIGYTIGGPE
jgi:hypothetical protein